MIAKPLMQPEEFRLIKEFVATEFGLVLDEDRSDYFSSRLLPRLERLGLDSYLDYYTCLKFSPRGPQECQQLVSVITNNETYFFREEAQLDVITQHVFPHLKEKKHQSGGRTIRIYSAGCSSGEEVYTLAMLLLESGQFIWDWDVTVTGIDLDPEMVTRATRGVYGGRAFQTTPPQYLERYFKKVGDCFEVKDILRKVTRFEEGNLLKLDPPSRQEKEDVIFCRNVFIYFSEETVRQIVSSFTGMLQPEGYLFLGHSESLTRITSDYQPIRHPGAIIYRKRD